MFHDGATMARLILLNKPYNVLCQFTGGRDSTPDAPKTRATLADHVPVPGVYPAGRLDRDSEGLVVLTDDGALQHRIADPRHKRPKTYWVQVEGEPDATALATLRRGVRLKDGVTRPAEVHTQPSPTLWPRTPPVRYRAAIPTTWLSLTLTEGRNRQVRRMTAAVGHPTLRLIRYAIGDWTLDGLQPGEWRELTLPDDTTPAHSRNERMGPPRHRRRHHRARRPVSPRRGE